MANDETVEPASEMVLVKKVSSPFIGTDLAHQLRATGLRSLVIYEPRRTTAPKQRPEWQAISVSIPGLREMQLGHSIAPAPEIIRAFAP